MWFWYAASMDLERVFTKPRSLRALASLGAGEFEWLPELEALHAVFCRRRHLGWTEAAALVQYGQSRVSAHLLGQALVYPFLIQVLSTPGNGFLSHCHEPTAFERVSRATHALGQRGIKNGVAPACSSPSQLFGRTRNCQSPTISDAGIVILGFSPASVRRYKC